MDTYSIIIDGYRGNEWRGLKRTIAMAQAIATKRCNPTQEIGIQNERTAEFTEIKIK